MNMGCLERRFEYEPNLEGARDLREIKQIKRNVGPDVRTKGAGFDPEVLDLITAFLPQSQPQGTNLREKTFLNEVEGSLSVIL